MANIVRWDPFREMLAFRSAMDRLIDSTLAGSDFAWQAGSMDVSVDVIENQDNFVVKASLPGVAPEDIDVTYNNSVLTIKGEFKDEQESDEGRYHVRERHSGSFVRSFSLPVHINADAVDASFDKGVLTLTLPKIEEAKPKRISVKSSPMIEARIADNKN